MHDSFIKHTAVLHNSLTEAEWHIYASVNYSIIGSDYGWAPNGHQFINLTNDLNPK